MLHFLVSLLVAAAATPAPPISLDLAPGPGATFAATVSGPAGDAPSGDFRGEVRLNGSAASMRVSGRATRAGGRLSIRTAPLLYADVPADWSARFRPYAVDVELDGSVGAHPIAWRGHLTWDEVGLSADAATGARFLSLSDMRLTDVAFSTSRGVASLTVRNPFTFPLTIASSEYRIEAAGREVGRGATQGILIRPSRASVVEFPVELDNGDLAAAAGRTLLAAGDVEARLRGWIKVRLAGGDVRIPVDLGGRLRNAS
jgi:LEA14-like dessication related protein